jgi:hypothetical protein
MHNTGSAPPQSGLLTLTEIAAWQVPEALDGYPRIIATLPALQRGAVWKPQQIEALWDSLVRGFPVGAFMLAPFDQARGEQDARLKQPGVPDPTHHLLDGQQRSTAIALAFLNPWTAKEDVTAALWVDLAEPPESSDMEFVFRVATRSHPWGYRRTDSSKPVETRMMREALAAYRRAAPDEYATTRPGKFPLSRVWPIDATTPIPVSLLIDETRRSTENDADLAQRLLRRMEVLPFWGDDTLAWQQSVSRMLTGHDATSWPRFRALTQRLRSLLDDQQGYRIPFQVLPEIPLSSASQDGKQDPVETLFVRVNQGGTRLEGEELIYSILKSAWTDAPAFIEKMQHRLALPSRLVILSSRLVLAQGDSDTRLPAAPDVSRFRRLMHGGDSAVKNFERDLKAFVKNEGHDIFRVAHDLLATEDFALPPVLATELAQKSPPVMLLLLRWIMRMWEQSLDPLALEAKPRKMLLGFITALGWFAQNSEQAIAAVWPKLQQASGSDLRNFFSHERFADTLSLTQIGGLRMLPLIPPRTLEKMIEDSVTSARGSYGGFGDPTSDFWGDWNWGDWMSGRLNGNLERWFAANIQKCWGRDSASAADNDLDPKSKYQEAWTAFIDTLRHSRSILLYAQRRWLVSWFPDYDPSQPDQLEDTNRPWDFDHIHPHRYLRSDNGGGLRNIPQIIREWHGSIGNLRAWPLELNRSDGDLSPRIKLTDSSHEDEEVEKSYGLSGERAKKSASFIHREDWVHWKGCVPKEEHQRNYLAHADNYGTCRQELIRAVTTRFVALYREWYDTLEIKSLMFRACR